ncbi:MAG TPA: transcription-repair coupling factor [Epulopiscium sp.]|nr:transcription-repair coupling factor [Candidatus Epulonipiscium sp.]
MAHYNTMLSYMNGTNNGDNRTVCATGLIDAQKPHMMYGVASHLKKPIMVVTHSENKAKQIADDLKFLCNEETVGIYPAQDVLFYGADVHSADITVERMMIKNTVLKGEKITIVTSVEALINKTMSKEALLSQTLEFQVGQILEITALQKSLVQMGYERTSLVENVGQFAIRGGIIDIYPVTAQHVYRIELWDDEIDSIRTVNPFSQRSIEKEEYVKILPMNEQLDQSENNVMLLDYIDPETLIIIDEPVKVKAKCEQVNFEFETSIKDKLESEEITPSQIISIFNWEEILLMFKKHKTFIMMNLEHTAEDYEIAYQCSFRVHENIEFYKNFDLLERDIGTWKKQKKRIILFAGIKARALRLVEELEERGIICSYSNDLTEPVIPGQVVITRGVLSKGFIYEEIGLVIISDKDLFGKEKKKRKRNKKHKGSKIESFIELKAGDYIVHENHGIGVFNGIEKMIVDNISKDYLKIGYADSGVLYVNINQMDMVQKYIGADGKKPKLSKLGGQEWKKVKARAKQATQELAKELIQLYAKREASKGFIYSPDSPWQKEFEDTFPYEETDDQLQAIEDVKQDMETDKVMDRLLCGDVGYGKTEVAIRAAFKAVQDSKQVVYLVPTTILAQQHYNRFVERMRNFPIKVELLSRFRTPKQIKEALASIERGSADIVIGTHRVLSKDVKFKDLGLVLVDEEQRFGVTHKERLKQLRSNVDVLTLTATPIPRTLHMSLVGIRDMSLLEDPPLERRPIQTYVMEYSPEFAKDAIKRELSRGGQVYFLYNRVESIDKVALEIQKMVPGANVAFAHGQMHERELEGIMLDFIEGEIDVLVCTTIIETGLDVANTNTIIIQDADRMGLSQLYQLRGRVGRSNRIAYAYLMYKKDRVLPEIAEKRLQAIKQFTQFGSGFKIAMRDLEIRGAGNLLGDRQHGHMDAIGYDLYSKLLKNAVIEEKGENVEEEFETSVEININAYIPPRYIEDEIQKIDIYKKISIIRNKEDYNEIQEEIEDRYGDLPQTVQNLLDVAFIKATAHDLDMTSVVVKTNDVIFNFKSDARLNLTDVPALIDGYKGTLKFKAGEQPYFTLTDISKYKDNIPEYIKNVLHDMKKLKYTEK